jgi:RNA polymerase sigma factor (sigma-70 family)
VNVLPPLEELYSSHGAAVFRRARELLGDEAEAEEVLHDVFASLLRRPEQFRGQSSVMTFLYRMATNLALQRLRNSRTRQRLLKLNHDPDGEHVSHSQEACAQLRELLTSLPEELGSVAIYYYLDEMTQDEIAMTLGCSRQRVGKLLEQLKNHPEVRA